MKCHEIALYFLMKPRCSRELKSNSYTQGIKETMHWLPIDKLNEYRAYRVPLKVQLKYPTFFREKLNNMKDCIEHIVTYE